MSDSARIYLAGSARTPIGNFGGAFKKLSAADLGVVSATASLKRSGVNAEQIESSWIGCARQAGVGPNIARQIAHRIGIPVESPASTINMACASSLEALISAARAIQVGDIKSALIGGTESMSNIPHMILGARWGIPLGQSKLIDAMYHDGFHCRLCDMLMGATADLLATQKNISRQQQDEYALTSQQRTEAAQQSGFFDNEITPVMVKSRREEKEVAVDERPRHGATLAGLSALKPIFSSEGTVTAGNACGITDGASSMVVLSGDAVDELGVTPEAELLGYSQSGVSPEVMGLGPVPAVNKLLAQKKMTLADVDLLELNEAFASQVLACQDELGFDSDCVNVHGGAIALGHPIGATGTRILTTLIHALKRQNKEIGVATLCVSGGQGTAVMVRRV